MPGVAQKHPMGIVSGQVQHPWEVVQQHPKGVASELALRGSPKAPQGCSEYVQHPWGVVQQHPKGVVSMGIMTTPYQVGCKSGVSPEHPIFNSVGVHWAMVSI